MNKKKFIFDVVLNIVASAIPIATLQLIILPSIASQLESEHYGLIITLISFLTLFSHPFGNVLNNIRLLQSKESTGNTINGDFNILLLLSLLINSFIIVIGAVYFEGKLLLLNIVLLLTISSLILIREYLVVTFRIILNYKAILLNNLILSCGYLIGLFLFFITGYWQFVYIIGLTLSLLYILKNTKLLEGGFRRTPNLKGTMYRCLILFMSTFLKTVTSYADKLLIFPLLGSSAVAIYYSSTIIGKIISMGITPLSSVMLSYLSKIERLKFRNFIYILFFTGIAGILGYLICIFISRPLLSLLYPKWVEESMKLIYITTGTAIIGALNTVLHPINLRFNNINWQVLINGIYLVAYIFCSLSLYKLYGLVGFCSGILLASIIKLMTMIMVFMFNHKNL